MKTTYVTLACLLALASTPAIGQNAAEPKPAPVNQAVPVAPLPLAVALKASMAAMKACNALGLAPTVTYVDREGVTRVVLVSDGAGQLSITSSQRKAYTSATVGFSTEEFHTAFATLNQGSPAVLDPQLIQFGGGLPIFKKGVLVGGIGVGGAEPPGTLDSSDVRCALAGLASIKADLE